MSTPALKTYQGNCHCGRFKFEVELPHVEKVHACDCSICVRKGYLRIQLTEGKVRVLRGEGELRGYEFAQKRVRHEFCAVCGTPVWIREYNDDREDLIALNVRTLLDVNPFKLEVGNLGGKSLEPAYIPPVFKGTLPEIGDENVDLKTYTGSCHCGAVSLVVKTTALSATAIHEDNCSICVRNANKLIYPHKSHVAFSGTENLAEYTFGSRIASHNFCKHCGVPVSITLRAPSKEIWDSFSDDVRAALESKRDLVPVRIAVLQDVEWEMLYVERRDRGTEGYVVD